MTIQAEVQFNDEDPIVVSGTEDPTSIEQIDYNRAVAAARELRARTDAEPLDEVELVVTVARFQPEVVEGSTDEDA